MEADEVSSRELLRSWSALDPTSYEMFIILEKDAEKYYLLFHLKSEVL